MAWNPVTDPRLTGYRLYFAPAPFAATPPANFVNVGNSTTYMFDAAAFGISGGATVYFGVSAIAGALESPLSNVVFLLVQ